MCCDKNIHAFFLRGFVFFTSLALHLRILHSCSHSMNYFGFMAFSFKLSATPLTEAWLSEGNKMKSTKLNNLLDITSYMLFL